MILMKIMFEGREIEVTKEMIGVYAVWVDNYVYVGSGRILDRKSGNKSKLNRNVHSNKTLQEAYNNNKEGYRFELLAICSDDETCRQHEQNFIDYFRKIDNVIVCNKRVARNGCTSKAYNKYKRLTEEDVIKIKELLDTYSVKQLAELFNCSVNAIYKIKSGCRWQNI